MTIYGYSTKSLRPRLHVHEHTDKRYGTTIWKCGGAAAHGELVSEPNGLPFCRRCPSIDGAGDSVYFARRGDLVKIGWSSDPAVRAAVLNATLLATVPGDGRTEHAMHLAFAHLHVTGEWFRAESDLLTVINNIALINAQQVAS